MNPNHAIAKAAKRNGKFASGSWSAVTISEVLLAPRKARSIREPMSVRILFPIYILCSYLSMLHPFATALVSYLRFLSCIRSPNWLRREATWSAAACNLALKIMVYVKSRNIAIKDTKIPNWIDGSRALASAAGPITLPG